MSEQSKHAEQRCEAHRRRGTLSMVVPTTISRTRTMLGCRNASKMLASRSAVTGKPTLAHSRPILTCFKA